MNWSLALPELVLSIVGMAILLFGVIRKGDNNFLASMFTLGGFLVAAVLVLACAPGTGFHGQFVVDPFSLFMKELILAGAAFSLILSLDFNRQEGLARFEFPVLMLFATVGMMIMASASNMMTLYLGLELLSLALYVLAAFARDDLRSTEAGLKYFVLGALASGLVLYGISLIYGFSGTMDFAALTKLIATPAAASPGLIVGLVFVVAGLIFKISAVPFHMWTPDVYEGAPAPVTSFFAMAPKVAAMALLLRVLATPFGHLLGSWQQLIILVSLASMILGALAAIGQTQHQAADGVFLDRAYGLRADRPRRRHARGHPRRARLSDRLRVHERRRLRLHHRDAPPRPRGGADQRARRPRPNRSGAGAGDGRGHVLDGRHPAAVGLLRQALRVPRRRAERACGRWRSSAC